MGFVLGLRHGIDWDHIAAITDISGSAVSADEDEAHKPTARLSARRSAPGAFWLATLYALGHATMVVGLGLLAIWASEILPSWLDPMMERVVGVTLLVLGVWVFYSLWRYGTSFRLQSRWMLALSLLGRAWAGLKSKITGQAVDASHSHEAAQYGPKTAFAIGLLHGIGAETGSQALLLGSVAGVTSRGAGSLLLLSFVCGLLISNSLIAVFSVAGFVSSIMRQRVYTTLGVVVGVFSLFVGSFFVAGRGDALPDLQVAMDRIGSLWSGHPRAPKTSGKTESGTATPHGTRLRVVDAGRPLPRLPRS